MSNSLHRLLWIAALVVVAALAAGTLRAGEPSTGDAQQIVFSSNRSGPWRIWSVRPDGSDLRQLTQARDDEQDVDPAIALNRQALLFTSTRGGTTGVWKARLDGTAAARVCDGDQAQWSADGLQIVYRDHEKLFVRTLADGSSRRITPDDWPHPSGPAWSPDGRQIALACRWDAGNALYLVAAAGGKPSLLYDRKPACEPQWSPDGTRLVYETETNICTIGADGKNNRVLTYFGGVQRYGRYSPDGQSIVYCQGASERGPWELFIIPATGGSPRQLTQGASDMNPDWR